MGVAILFIMASHTLGGFAAYGIIGVEWFLILSAIGQYYSLMNIPRTLHFYKKRLARIIPAYLIVAVPVFIFDYSSSIRAFLIRLTGFNLVLWGELTFWFVLLIVICYLIAPFYFKIVNSKRYGLVIPFVVVTITFILSFHLPKTEILVTRIPVFLLGMHLAKYVYEGAVITGRKKIRLCFVISVLSVLLLLTIFIDWTGIESVRLIYFFCAIPSLLFVLWVVKLLPFLQGILSFIGSISYELYLVHQPVALALCNKLPLPRAWIVILSYGFAFILAYLLHLIVKRLMKNNIR